MRRILFCRDVRDDKAKPANVPRKKKAQTELRPWGAGKRFGFSRQPGKVHRGFGVRLSVTLEGV